METEKNEEQEWVVPPANTAASIPLSLAPAADPPAALLVPTGGDTIEH